MTLLTPISVAAVFFVLLAVCVAVGRRQQREAGASVRRLLAVSAVLSAGICLPLVIALLAPVGVWVALFCAYFGAVVVLKSLRPVGRIFSRGLDLPQVRDGELLARIAELSGRMGVRPPNIRLLGSVTPDLVTNAVAGGLVAPTLVVADGVLHRLAPAERDAILAHELGHVARSTVWVYIGLFLLAQVVATVVSAFTDPWVAGMFGVVLAFGLVKIAGHREEPAADRLAARAVGHVVTAAALDKLHAAASARPGLLGALVHATQTHPSRAVRLAALRADAPVEERAAIDVDPKEVRRHVRTRAIVLVTWCLLMASALGLGMLPGFRWVAFAVLTATGLAPPLLAWSLHARDFIEHFRLGLATVPWRVMLRRLAVLVLAGAVYAALPRMSAWGISPWVGVGVFAVLVFAAVLPWPSAERRVLASVRSALSRRAFDEALALYDRLPTRARRHPRHRRWKADVLALVGDRAAAAAELENLLAERPAEVGARLGLAVILGPVDPVSALRHAEVIEQRVPGTHTVAVLRAALLRRLGRLDEARDAVRAALASRPRTGQYLAAAARIEVTAGCLQEADTLLEQAEALAPGDALVALVRAELALATGDVDAARAELERAAKAAHDQPMMLLDLDVAALRARVDAMSGGATTAP